MSYNSTVTADSPVSYWKLDETSGTTATDSVGSNSGTYTGGYTLNQVSQVSGTAISLNGSTGYVTVPTAASLEITGNISIECWVKPNSSATNLFSRALSKPASGSVTAPFNDYALEVNSGGPFGFDLSISNTQQNLAGTTPIVVGNWYYLVGVYDGSTMFIYVNGVLNASRSQTGSINNHSQAFQIGRLIGGNFYNGLIDEVAVYNTALSSTLIRNHFLSLLGSVNSPNTYNTIVKATSGLVSYWPLDEISGAIAKDDYGSFPLLYSPSGVTLNQLKLISGSSALFDGSTGLAQGGAPPVTTATSCTIEAWIKLSSTSVIHQTIFYNGLDGTNGYGLVVNGFSAGYVTDGTLFLLIGPTWVTTTYKFTDTNRHYVALVMLASVGFIIYVDGVAIKTDTTTSALAPTSTFFIGGKIGSGYFGGYIDEVAIYNTPLSSTIIQSHYIAGLNIQSPSSILPVA